MKKIFRVCIALLLCFSLVTPAFALDGIWHNPYGIDDLYDHEPTEIYPLTPIAGEMIYIKSTTCPIEPGQSVWLTYTKNGEPQQDVGAEWKYNDGNNSYWEAAIGPFAQGDVIEYTVCRQRRAEHAVYRPLLFPRSGMGKRAVCRTRFAGRGSRCSECNA